MTNNFDNFFYKENPDDTYYTWDHKKFIESMSPTAQRNHERWVKVLHIKLWMNKHIPWMNWPILKLVYLFWASIFEDGIVATCKPRWGALTFSFLNDGFKPTLWHTWRQLTHDWRDPYTGIYPDGAPRNLNEAWEWDQKWARERQNASNT